MPPHRAACPRAARRFLDQSLSCARVRGVPTVGAGRVGLPVISAPLREIAPGVRAAGGRGADGPISLTNNAELAENWLMRRISGVWSAHPGVAVVDQRRNTVIDLNAAPHSPPPSLTGAGTAGGWSGAAEPTGRNAQSSHARRCGRACRAALTPPTDAGPPALAAMPWLSTTKHTGSFFRLAARPGVAPRA